MIKIIHFTSWKGLGGGATVVFDIVNQLRDGFNFSIVTPTQLFSKKYSEMGIKLRKVADRGLVGSVRAIRDIIQEERPDIIHIHGTRAAFWVRSAIIGLKNKPKVIYTLHGFHIIRRIFFIRWPLILIERFLNHWTDVLVCVGEADKELVLKYRTMSRDKVTVIKNGIDVQKFQVAPELIESTKEKLGLKGMFVLCSIGRFHPQKDFSTLLKALKLVVDKIKNPRLLIIGDGPLRNLLEREARDLELNQYVKF